MSNALRAKDDVTFAKACEGAGIQPTPAQYSKFRRRFGAAYATLHAKDGGNGLFDMNGKFIGRIHEIPGLEFSDQRATGNVVPQEYGPFSKTPKAWPVPKKPMSAGARALMLAMFAAASRLAKREAREETK